MATKHILQDIDTGLTLEACAAGDIHRLKDGE